MTTETNNTTLIEWTVNKGQQDVIARQLLIIDDTKTKLRITIKSDSYDFQSYARAEVWNSTTLSWNEVYSLHYKEMGTRTGLAYLPNNEGRDVRHFTADFDRLLSTALKILL